MIYDKISSFLKRNRDVLLVKSIEESVFTGPEYCIFKSYLKEELSSHFRKQLPEIKLIQLEIPSSVSSSILKDRGYSSLFDPVSITKTKSLKPEGFAGYYHILPQLKHYYGSKVCYFSCTKSFRNEQSKKNKIIRSFEFDQLEFQFPSDMNKSLDQTVEIFNSFLKDKLYHNNLMIINKQDLPFYSKKTIDLEYISSDSKANEIIEGLEVSSSSQRQEKIIEVSMGVMRLFITLLVDSEREDGSIVIKDEKLKRLLKESNTKFSKKIV